MGFHKYTFPIRMIDTCNEPVMIVSGWTNDNYTIGFHKNIKKEWVATDLYSGTYICTASTRKACFEWIEKNEGRITSNMKTLNYLYKVIQFRELLKEILLREENA